MRASPCSASSRKGIVWHGLEFPLEIFCAERFSTDDFRASIWDDKFGGITGKTRIVILNMFKASLYVTLALWDDRLTHALVLSFFFRERDEGFNGFNSVFSDVCNGAAQSFHVLLFKEVSDK